MTYKLSQTEFKINSFSTDAGIEEVLSVKKIQSNNPAKNIGVNQTTKIIDSTNKSDKGVTIVQAISRLGLDTTGFGPGDIITDGLLLWYDIGDSSSYPGSGTTLTNLVSGGPDGVISGGPIYDSADGGSLDLDGSDDAITVNATGLNMSSGQTVFIILKPEEADAARRNPYNQAYGGYGTITHEPDGTFNYFHGTNGGNGNNYQGSNSIFTVAQNEVAAITVTRDQTNVKWYKNENLEATYANSYPNAVSTVNTILLGDGYVGHYLGKIYAVLVYDRGLTHDEIKNNLEFFRERLFPSITEPLVDVNAVPESVNILDENIVSVIDEGFVGDSSADYNIGRLDTTPKYFRIESIEDPDILVNRTVYTLASNKAVFEFNTRAEGDSDSGVVGGGGSGGGVVSSGPTQVWY